MALSFDGLRRQNVRRCFHWHPHGVASWSLADWAAAMMGEAGEVMEVVELSPAYVALAAHAGKAGNVVKKLNRERDNLVGNAEPSQELRDQLARELADTIIYADLLAAAAKIDLGEAVRATFNRKSDELGFDERL